MKQSKAKHPRQFKKALLILGGILLASLWFYPFSWW